MELRLDQLEEQHFSWNESFRIDPAELPQPDVVEIGEVACSGSVDKTQDGWVLRMNLSYPQTLSCVRCLEPVDAPEEIEVALLLVEDGEGESEEERELDREDLGIVTLTEPEIDTREVALEHLQLAVPMKPLCRDDCKGLCGHCGQNLNQGSCDCEPETDPRWSALQALKESVH